MWMIRRIVAVWVSLAMLFGFVVVVDVVTDITPPVKAIIITVDDSGGAMYTKIQDAINTSNDGDTVFVYNGTYYENVVVNKTINLIGEDRDSTVIDAGGSWDSGDTVRILVNHVNISGFTITGSGSDFEDAGLELNIIFHCNISNNNITSNLNYGLYIYFSSNISIINNNVTNNKHGIYLESGINNSIIGNTLIQNVDNGVFLSSSSKNKVAYNFVNNNNITTSNYGIRLFSSSYNNISFNNVTINRWGIQIHSSSNNTLINNNITLNMFGTDFVSSSNSNIFNKNIIALNQHTGLYFSSSSDNKMLFNNISKNGYDSFNTGYGITVTSSQNNTFLNNNLERNGFILGGGQKSYSNSHEIPVNNLINGKPVYYYKNEKGLIIDGINTGQLILSNCTDFNIINVSIDYTDIGILLVHSQYISVECSNLSFNNEFGIYLLSSTNCSIINNILMSNYFQGIRFTESTWNEITLNNILNTNSGIYLWKSNYNRINSNILSTNIGNGIYISYSHFNYVSGNTCFFNTYRGIYIDHSNQNSIGGNEIFSSTELGIDIYYSDLNIIFFNNIKFNDMGIMFSYSDENNLTGNNISHNTNFGIVVSQSYNNRVYHNNIINNTLQAVDVTNDGNQWDNGYPSGGNYWSDYIGNDNFNGPNQNISGSDGIGDNPYIIDLNSQDNYPLMHPFSNYSFLYEGWNLISIPHILSNTYLGQVFSSIQGAFNAVQWFNTTDPADPWKHNHTSKPSNLNDLNTIGHTMGFWIHITEPGGVLFQYPGTKPMESQTININPGWNLIGYPSLSNRNRTEALNNIVFDQDVDAIWTFNAATQTWHEVGPGDSFELGRGYWIHSKVTKVWDVPL
jgi:parallel beta-helix repeat protein